MESLVLIFGALFTVGAMSIQAARIVKFTPRDRSGKVYRYSDEMVKKASEMVFLASKIRQRDFDVEERRRYLNLILEEELGNPGSKERAYSLEKSGGPRRWDKYTGFDSYGSLEESSADLDSISSMLV